MGQALNLKLRGLYTHPNDLSEVPEGALVVADNVVVNKESVVEPRRGFDRLGFAFSQLTDRASKLFVYQDTILAHYSTKLARYNDLTGWVDFTGSYTAPTGVKIRSAEANNNFYFTTDKGVQVLDVATGEVGLSGIPRGLDCRATLTGTTGFMTNDSQVAYRVLWGIKDANNNLILGAPSQRATVANSTGGTRDVSLQITIPAGITTDHFYQVYRSGMSASAGTIPNDELGLVYEANPTSSEITARTLAITDSTPEDLRGATLYTSASQEGIAQANDEPPLAKDIAEFKGCLWFLNTKSKHRLYVTLLATGGTSGVQLNDTITIAGTTYTAKASESVSNREYQLFTAGTPAQNIANTALSLIRIINQAAANTSVYAYYVSGEDELPGKILIEERILGGSAFAATVSARGAAFNPVLPTSGTAVSSTNDEFKNGLYNSKLNEPEAVPIANFRRVGSAAKDGLRIIPLRDSLFILKEDGIWRVTGDYPSFQVDPLDLTTKLVAPESAVVLNNQIYALTDQGVVSISDTGIQVASRPIEISILELFGVNLPVLKSESFGISYETERKYILFVPSTSADTSPTQAYVLNTFTNTWTRWPLAKTCGAVRVSDDKLYLGDARSNRVNVERKTYTFRDYIDESQSCNIESFTGRTLTLTSVNGLEVGDLMFQSIGVYAQVTAIDQIARVVTVTEARSWTLGAAQVFKAIESVVEWVPQTGGNPGLLKHFQECAMIFKNNYFPQADIGFYSELSGSVEDTTVSGVYGGLWGQFSWGNIAWGGVQRPRIIRTYVPREKAMCDLLSVRFKHRMAYSKFELLGASLTFESISERMTR